VNRRQSTFLGVAFLILTGIVAGFYLSSSLDVQPTSDAQVREVSPESADFLDRLGLALSEISEAVKPAVVNISTEKTVKIQDTPFEHFFDDPFFRRFFGERGGPFGGPHEYKSRSLGSGVIVTDDGYILTNNHVIKDADKIKVLLNDKREFEGKVIGKDPKTDLAVIKIDAENLPTLKLGDSDKLNVGSLVIAVGNPYGLNFTVTMGIVSAVGRANVGIADYEDFIQTDAAINPGNSGGALVNTRGELVGINTAIFSTSGGYQGIGFAIPSNMARNVMDNLIKHGKVIRGWLGVTIQDITAEIAKHFDVKTEKGALVSDVVEDSPAEKAGFRRGDIIIRYDGREVRDTYSLRNMVASTTPGSNVTVKVIRNGKEKTLTVKIGELPETMAAPGEEGGGSALAGLSVRELTPELRERYGIPDKVDGVIVAGVAPGSNMRGKIRPGDVITEINKNPIRNLRDYTRAVRKTAGEKDILLLVFRKGSYVYITLKR